MAKSLRSKIKRRYRKLKRGHLKQIIQLPRNEELKSNCDKALAGIEYRQKQKANGFLHPEDSEAVFPQFTPGPIIDLRSNAITGSGTEFSGGNRKKVQELEHLDEIREKKKRMNQKSARIQSEESDDERINGDANMMQTQNRGTISKQKRKTSKIRKTFVF